MPAILTDDWFSMVEKVTAEAGELNVPAALQNLAINVVVNDAQGNNNELAFVNGVIKKGLSDDAPATLTLDTETLKNIFLEFNLSAAMGAFMAGKIKVQGNIMKVMALQTTKISPEMKGVLKQILANTEAA